MTMPATPEEQRASSGTTGALRSPRARYRPASFRAFSTTLAGSGM